jgi:hypothetical protein
MAKIPEGCGKAPEGERHGIMIGEGGRRMHLDSVSEVI